MRRMRAPAVLRCRPAASCAASHSRAADSPSSRWYLLEDNTLSCAAGLSPPSRRYLPWHAAGAHP